MGNPAGLLFLLLTVAGILGLAFVTVPGLEYMFGAATDTNDATIISIIAWVVILWISTGIFIALCAWGLILTVITITD